MKKKSPHKKMLSGERKQTARKRDTESGYEAHNLEQFTRHLNEEETFSRHPSNISLQHEALLALQNSSGNRVMRHALENLPNEKPHLIQRASTEEHADEGLAGFEIEETLEGHPFNEGEVMRQIESTLARQPAKKKKITANISLQSNPPTIVRPSEASLKAKYGANIAGWTKPTLNIRALPGRGKTITLKVTLDFKMELASSYTGDRLTILRDHENGHLTIGNNIAQTHAVDGLKIRIEALPRITQASVIKLVNAAHKRFKTAEGKQAKAYDKADYPRMKLAYFGAKTPLADLSKSYPNIKTMVSSLKAFNSGANKGNFANLAGAILKAHKTLPKDDLSRLQYNGAFKKMVSSCNTKVENLKNILGKPHKDKVSKLKLALETFTWTPSV